MAIAEIDGFTVETNTGTDAELSAALGVSEPAEASEGPSGDHKPASDSTQRLPEPSADSGTQSAKTDDGADHDRNPDGTFKPAHKRIAELTYHRREAERKAAQLEAELAALKANKATAASGAQETGAARTESGRGASEPFPDFGTWAAQPGNESESYEAYIDARTDHRTEQRLRVEREKAAAEVAGRQRIEHELSYVARRDAFRAKTPDFDTTVASVDHIGAPMVMLDAMTQHEHGPELAYYLAKHPDELTDLAAQTAHLDRSTNSVALVQRLLDSYLRPQTASPSGSVLSAARRTNAPPPIRPVPGSAIASDESPDEMDFGPEYIRKQNALDQKRGHRRL